MRPKIEQYREQMEKMTGGYYYSCGMSIAQIQELLEYIREVERAGRRVINDGAGAGIMFHRVGLESMASLTEVLRDAP